MTKHDLKLTENFNLKEFVREQDALPNPTILSNLKLLAQRLQVIRDITGKAIKINSGYRTKEHNLEIGGEEHSRHLVGMAADIEIADMTPQAVQKLLKNWSGGLGCYEDFTHIDIDPTKINGKFRRW